MARHISAPSKGYVTASGGSGIRSTMKTSATKTKAKAKKTVSKDIGFRKGDFVVYPTHGVGRVLGVETQEISGHTLHVIIINFDKDRMTLRVPVAKAKNSGLRRLSTRKIMDTALATLKGRSRVKRAMWSRRAQEYEAKINSGDPVSIAEVVRDLHRNADQPDQSYSERQIYQAALDRLVRELAAVESIDETAATQKLEQLLKAA
jgi:CarD family transcriptional regulator